MGLSMDIILLKYKLGMLANMIYDIKKSWIPNTNLEKALPHLEKACKYIKKELEETQKEHDKEKE